KLAEHQIDRAADLGFPHRDPYLASLPWMMGMHGLYNVIGGGVGAGGFACAGMALPGGMGAFGLMGPGIYPGPFGGAFGYPAGFFGGSLGGGLYLGAGPGGI